MRIRIARKICKRLGHGYPIDNIHRIENAVRTWKRLVNGLSIGREVLNLEFNEGI